MLSKDKLSNFFRPELSALSAYKVANATGFIKLDAMENPYSLPEKTVVEWLETLKHCELNRYPDPAASKLNAILKEVNEIPNNCDVLLGNGSDEIIQLLLMALPPNACVIAPEPSFVMYKQISASLGLNYHSVPLIKDSFELDLSAMLTAIKTYQPAIIFLAYPNNPTGNLFNTEAIKQIIENTEGLVVIDEAYAPFANASFMQQLTHYDNLLVMRTLSKLGLAGLRLGFIAGQPEIISELDKIRLPYNINVLTQITAVFALSQQHLFDEQTQAICTERAFVFEKLQQIKNITVHQSAANFILFKVPQQKADLVFTFLKEKGILIKNMSPQGGLLTDCLRVTIGTKEENQAFLAALTEVSF